MSQLFTSFSGTSKSEWVSILEKELKGGSLDQLQKFNRVEEIIMPSYLHRADAGHDFSDPGNAPYTRGFSTEERSWNIGSCFRIEMEAATNKGILEALNSGTTALELHAINERTINFSLLLKEVMTTYIRTTFYPKTKEQALDFAEFIGDNNGAIVFPSFLNLNKTIQASGINGYAVQQAGGTTWQELAIALAEGHEAFLGYIADGLTPEEAMNQIHFVFGIGNQYFFEVAKFRAFRQLWSQLVKAYDQEINVKTYITARTGVVNHSVSDPFTNLLRQTTEGMSAVLGGVDELVIQPYDWYTEVQNTDFTRRMSTNISLLLKEESYLDRVIDPSGGSYVIDELTRAIAERAWELFKEIEAEGGILENKVRAKLSESILGKSKQRIEEIQTKKLKRIGITVFHNPEKIENTWTAFPQGWNGLPTLNIEQLWQQ